MNDSTKSHLNIDAATLKSARLKTTARENDWRWMLLGASATIAAGLAKVYLFERFGK
jgi:hypothetical protein